MQKLLGKDKKRRRVIKLIENKRFILKSIFKNFNFFTLVR
jgi:ABC-type oligopeptide transport system substrate-binding subunit